MGAYEVEVRELLLKWSLFWVLKIELEDLSLTHHSVDVVPLFIIECGDREVVLASVPLF